MGTSEPSGILNFTREQLLPILRRALGCDVQDFHVQWGHQVDGPYGLHGEKLIPTFLCQCGGQTREITIFIKQHERWSFGLHEAAHYEYLLPRGAPVADFYGAIDDDQGREVLFIEYLDVVKEHEPYGEFLSDERQLVPFLQTAARVNAIVPDPHHARRMQQWMAQRSGMASWSWPQKIQAVTHDLERLGELSRRGHLGGGLDDLVLHGRLEVQEVMNFARDLIGPVEAMPLGLCVSDYYPHTTGWRRGTRELLVFDLELVSLEPRFWDIAPWIGPDDRVLPRCRPREELAQAYLQEYISHSGSDVGVPQLLHEAHVLWLAWLLTIRLPWYLQNTVGPPTDKHDSSPDRRERSRQHLRQILELLFEFSRSREAA